MVGFAPPPMAATTTTVLIIQTSNVSDVTGGTITLNGPVQQSTMSYGNWPEPEYRVQVPVEMLPTLLMVCLFGYVYWQLTEFAAIWPLPVIAARLKRSLESVYARLRYPVGET